MFVRSSLEANYVEISADGDVQVGKKLGVPTFGSIRTKCGSVNIGALYGPTVEIENVLENETQALENLKAHSINVTSSSTDDVVLGSSHGTLSVEAPNAEIHLKGISNTALYVRD